MTVTTVVIGADHAGFSLKEFLACHLQDKKLAIIDIGCHSTESVDYPDIAALLAGQMRNNPGFVGLLICGTGIGISIAANRFDHIRCGLCHDVTTARLTRQHNDANVLAMGSRVIGEMVAAETLDAFLDTEFEGGRHIRRVEKLGSGS